MGLAALSTPQLKSKGRIVWTAEYEPVYVSNIARNYEIFSQFKGSKEQLPNTCEPVDLSKNESLQIAKLIKKNYSNIHFVLAGPPCQGFSSANRRTRHYTNPNNRLSVTSLDYIKILQPNVFILENVPGIRSLKTSINSSETTIEILQNKLQELNYTSRIMLLDAADYGVPQFRQRSFLVAIKDYSGGELPGNFVPTPTHGPGRQFPYVTVQQAIGDLPETINGSVDFFVKYKSEPSSDYQIRMREFSNEIVKDHLTTKHSDYVLERYKHIPQGSNWKSIEKMMTNYTDPSRTHQNIYYRLKADQPSRTIGNFRKSMMIHPFENRGLSLREAARLQSLPDWISFIDPKLPLKQGKVQGLNACQQQIGNAVSYLLTEALVSHIAKELNY